MTPGTQPNGASTVVPTHVVDARQRILIVDDDVDFAESIAEIMRLRGVECYTAQTSTDALSLLGQHHVMVALIDLRLGGESGLELIPSLKSRQPDLPCILMTAYGSVEVVVEGLRVGAYDYLRKPILAEELYATVERCIERGRLLDDKRRAEKELAEHARMLLQSQKMEALGRLAGGVAHDFNNLLTVVLVSSELLRGQARESGNQEMLEDIEVIEESARRGAELTHRLLAVARSQALNAEVVDLNRVLVATEALLQRVIGEDIDVQLFPATEPAPVRLDVSQIEQAILNLAVNARDAMPRGGHLSIRCSHEPADAKLHSDTGRTVVISVEDDGEGMDEGKRSLAFEPFFTTKEKGKGTGLGLSMVLGFVRQCGGEVELESEPGRGTIVRLLFPESSSAPTDPRLVRSARPALEGTTVLIIDDDQTVRQLVRRTLRKHGCVTLEAMTTDHALQLCRDHDGDIDVLLTDVVMPGRSGVELAREAAGLRPGIRVLYMTGYGAEATVADGLRDGDSLVLQKPFSITDLLAAIADVIGTRTR